MNYEPIGFFQTPFNEAYELPFQPGIVTGFDGMIELNQGQNFETALRDLNGFERIWLIFQFHKSSSWKPVVTPPRGHKKRGVFATRSPHRPNSIGMSCVTLLKIEGRSLYIENHDLIDGTPILDIKPYLSYVDSFPNSKSGWLEGVSNKTYSIDFELIKKELDYLLQNHDVNLFQLIQTSLAINPYPSKSNRITECDGFYELACKTWRLNFSIDDKKSEVQLKSIFTGYQPEVLAGEKPSLWDDVDIHNDFIKLFS